MLAQISSNAANRTYCDTTYLLWRWVCGEVHDVRITLLADSQLPTPGLKHHCRIHVSWNSQRMRRDEQWYQLVPLCVSPSCWNSTAAEARVPWPHRFTSVVGVNQRRRNLEAGDDSIVLGVKTGVDLWHWCVLWLESLVKMVGNLNTNNIFIYRVSIFGIIIIIVIKCLK